MTAYGCTCPWTPEDTWLSGASRGHGGGYEPGSQQEFDPGCPEHGDSSTATVALCPECGVERPVVEMHYERSPGVRGNNFRVQEDRCGFE